MAEKDDRRGTDGRAERGGGRGQRRGASPSRDERRDRRTAEAMAHVADMHDRFAAEIDRAVKATRFYDKAPVAKAPARVVAPGAEDAAPAEAPVLPSVTVVGQDSVAAVIENGRGIASACALAVLDFASFTQPGGGYDRGTMAQEQALCAESFLYNVLSQYKGWYAENRRRNINCELYRDRALVVPRVRFERERYHSYADVIVAAAPNARRAKADYHVSDEALERSMRARVRLVLAIADELGHAKLVLGAFGCGVFGWDAATVAEFFREELASGSHVATQVIFAVPEGRHDDHLARFQFTFATFPDKNDTPFMMRPAAPVRPVKPVEDDGGEEDWRKYL